jgi:hypothetical protein
MNQPVLGSGCAKCSDLHELTEQAAGELGEAAGLPSRRLLSNRPLGQHVNVFDI